MNRNVSSKSNALRTAAKVMVALVVMFLAACAQEDLKDKAAPAAIGPRTSDSVSNLQKYWDKSVKSLVGNATPHDTMCYSWTEFAQQSIMKYSTQDGVLYSMNFSPEASLNVRLTPARQEVGSELELPTYRVKRETVYDTPINEGLYLGRKFKLRDTQADGSIAEIEATWRCLGIITAEGDTVLPPHIEFSKDIVLDSIHVEKFGEQTELDKPHKLVHCYTASYTSKGITGGEKTMKVQMRPWRIKSITDDPQVKTGEPTYDIKWEGCPVTKLHLVQTTPTNKGNVVVDETFDVVFNVSVPEAREQASLDSTFAKTSKGELKYAAIGDTVKHANGFQSLNYTGGWTSRNKGLENGSNVETTATITASMPVKFANEYGSVDIKPLEPSFEEGGFAISSLSEDVDYHLFKTVNTIIPKLGDCTLDVLDEVVNLKVAKEKPIIVVDSVYVYGGNGDSYPAKKIKYFSDGSKLEFDFSYDGHHSASATNFGEKVVSNLNWTASNLKSNGSSKDTEKKEFSKTTYYEITNVTSNVVSDASNGSESGQFGFTTVHQIVTFVDGDTRHTWEERKVVLSGKGAQPASNYTLTVKDGVSYKGHTYNMSAGVVFDGETEDDVTSQGLLLMEADEISGNKYNDGIVWSGNVFTTTVTKTEEHTFADDKVESYTTSYEVSMTDLADGRIDAENTSFAVTASNSENALEPVVDGFFTIKPRERVFTYVVSNGAVERQMTNRVIDVIVEFNDGVHTATFDGTLTLDKADNFGSAYTDGDFTVTPLTTTVTAVASGNGAPTLSTKGVTNIYVKNIETQYRLRGEFIEEYKENSYFNVYAEKSVDGGVTWSEMDKMIDFVAERHGRWNPDVASQVVTSYDFVTEDTTREYETEPAQTGKGTNKRFDVINVSKIEYFWKALFPSYKDADGNDKRDISGSQVQWVNKLIYHNPETGEAMPYEVNAYIKTSINEVKDGVYTRQVDVYCQNQVVDSQVGTVTLERQ